MLKDAFPGMLLLALLAANTGAAEVSHQYLEGVWNNFNFTRPAQDWSEAAKDLGGKGALMDMVVAQDTLDGLTYLPFPYPGSEHLVSISDKDRIEPYLDHFDRENHKVILSIQPGRTDPLQLIQILLSRYGHHQSIIGINVDLEWKRTGEANHASNEERDAWISEIKEYDPDMQLFLTYFRDRSYFPDDDQNLVILFDGEDATQSELLKQYQELSRHYQSVGIYTGYKSSHPQTASDQRILSAVPKTRYIIHTQDVFPKEKILIFVMSDVQVDWLESTSVELLNLHQQKNIPVVVGVIPRNLDNLSVGGGFLPGMLHDLHQNNSDLFEIAEYAYSPKACGIDPEQNETMRSAYLVLHKLGIRPATLLPSMLKADEMTLNVAEELGFSSLVTTSPLKSEKLRILNSLISLKKDSGQDSKLKSPQELMDELDSRDQDALVILYPILDFSPDSRRDIRDLAEIMDALKQSKRYRIMTARQYFEAYPMADEPKDDYHPQSSGNMQFGAFALLLVWRFLSGEWWRKH